MYANCWLNQPGTPNPGDYPSGGPLAPLVDIWHAGAPALDMLCPDLYVREFAKRCEQFTRGGNPLFIPETNSGGAAALNVLYAVGKFNAICFSPFGIDGYNFIGGVPPIDSAGSETPFSQCYKMLSAMAPVILQHEGDDSMTGFLIGNGAADEAAKQQQIKLGNYTLTVKAPAPFRFGTTVPSSGRPSRDEVTGGTSGLIVSIATDEFFILSTGVSLSFESDKTLAGHAALASVDEGFFVDGKWIPGRRLNGDESDHNRAIDRVLRRPFQIYRIKLYQRP